MNMTWCYGGKLVEADNKTVALHSKGTIQAVQLIADMFSKHKIIPKGAIAWDNTGNNKAYPCGAGNARIYSPASQRRRPPCTRPINTKA